jgi:hypothetical protein
VRKDVIKVKKVEEKIYTGAQTTFVVVWANVVVVVKREREVTQIGCLGTVSL